MEPPDIAHCVVMHEGIHICGASCKQTAKFYWFSRSCDIFKLWFKKKVGKNKWNENIEQDQTTTYIFFLLGYDSLISGRCKASIWLGSRSPYYQASYGHGSSWRSRAFTLLPNMAKTKQFFQFSMLPEEIIMALETQF